MPTLILKETTTACSSLCIDASSLALVCVLACVLWALTLRRWQGNTGTKRGTLEDGGASAGGEDAYAPSSPPCSPGSPLTYSPQIPMEPMPKVDQAPLGRDHAAEFHGLAGWPAQPKLVPTVIVCAPWLSSAILPASSGIRAPGACALLLC